MTSGIPNRPENIVPPKQATNGQAIQNEVIIDEAEIKTALPGQTIFYPNVDSCTTLTLVLNTGESIGAHFVGVPNPAKGQKSAIELVQEMKTQVGNREVKKLFLVGTTSETWARAQQFIPSARPSQGCDFMNAPGLALGVFFNAEEAYVQSTNQVNIKITNGDLAITTVATGERVPIRPNQVIDPDVMSVQELADFIEF